MQEIESDKDFLCTKLGIEKSDLEQLDYVIESSSKGLFSRAIIFDLKKCPIEILDKISRLENGNIFNYDLEDLIDF